MLSLLFRKQKTLICPSLINREGYRTVNIVRSCLKMETGQPRLDWRRDHFWSQKRKKRPKIKWNINVNLYRYYGQCYSGYSWNNKGEQNTYSALSDNVARCSHPCSRITEKDWSMIHGHRNHCRHSKLNNVTMFTKLDD